MQQLSDAMRILTEISKDRGLAHTTEVGDLFLNPRNYIPDLPTPLAGGQRKIICGANEFSWPPARGVGI